MEQVDGKVAFLPFHVVEYLLRTATTVKKTSGKAVARGGIEVLASFSLASGHEFQGTVFKRDKRRVEPALLYFLHAGGENVFEIPVENHVVFKNQGPGQVVLNNVATRQQMLHGTRGCTRHPFHLASKISVKNLVAEFVLVTVENKVKGNALGCHHPLNMLLALLISVFDVQYKHFRVYVHSHLW